jgi:nucleotide-binding universal stress UspA family protein
MDSITVVTAITGMNEGHTEDFLGVIEKLGNSENVDVAITHVYDEGDTEKLVEMFDVDLDQPQHLDAIAKHNTAVQMLSDGLDKRNISYWTRGAIGDPVAKILEIAEDESADFILIAGRERSPAGKAIFGSTSQRVLLNASRPVIFIGMEADN